MGRLILIEGIPGSGKTTISQKAADYLSEFKKTNFYEEGDGHPADLGWCACIPEDQFSGIIEQFPAYEELIKQHLYREEGYIIVPYTRLKIKDMDFYHRMESFEVYDNRIGLEAFERLHKKRWSGFADKAEKSDEYTVFECAFLQNHINELLLFHEYSVDKIEKYLLELLDTVRKLKPVLIYLSQPDVYETIRRVSDDRLDEQGNKVWMERVIGYIENAPYGIKHELKGFDGMVRYFAERKRIELNIIKKLPIEVFIIENEAYNWGQVWSETEGILKGVVQADKVNLIR